jgi:2-polyprenyl-3-methyl-5-hydroxy-6-metoxy-1,4-benzoquinol methylase
LIASSPATQPTYLDDVQEFMHGHRKKTLFLIDALRRHTVRKRLEPGRLRVLELGCGNGRIVTLPVGQEGYAVLGVDSHGPSIESAREHNRLENVRFQLSDFRDAPRTGDFDAVILSDVLEHVDDPGRMLDVARAALRPDGVLLVSIPNGYGPFEVEQYLIRKRILLPLLAFVRAAVSVGVRAKQTLRGAPAPDPTPPGYNLDSPHLQHFTLRRFEQLAAQHSFVITRRRNGAWFGGDLSYFLFYFVPGLVPLSLRVADALPAALVSTWYFECRPSGAASPPVS